MAKKTGPGRPPGSQNKVGRDQKEFIRGLLGETQEQFRDTFIFYAKSAENNPELRKRFSDLYVELSKMIVPKPIEVGGSLEVSDFETLLGQASKWNDEEN